jgi:hypothetical protein
MDFQRGKEILKFMLEKYFKLFIGITGLLSVLVKSDNCRACLMNNAWNFQFLRLNENKSITRENLRMTYICSLPVFHHIVQLNIYEKSCVLRTLTGFSNLKIYWKNASSDCAENLLSTGILLIVNLLNNII